MACILLLCLSSGKPAYVFKVRVIFCCVRLALLFGKFYNGESDQFGLWDKVFACVCPGNDLAISRIVTLVYEQSTGGPVSLSAAVGYVSGSASESEAGRIVRKREMRAEEFWSAFQQNVVT